MRDLNALFVHEIKRVISLEPDALLHDETARAPISWWYTIIWLVTFQIQISNLNFQIQNKLCCLPVFVAKPIFKTHQHFCFLCFHSCWRFFWFHKAREIKSFYFSRKYFGKRKLSCPRLNFGKILFAGTKRAVSGGQYSSILRAWVANQNTEFPTYSPLAELAI